MNICFISREFRGSVRNGGIKSYLDTVVQSLIKSGHRVTVICAADNIVPIEQTKNFRVVRIPCFDFYKSNTFIQKALSVSRGVFFYDLYRIFVALTFFRLCKGECFDLIEIPDYGAEAKYILLFKRFIAGKVIIRLHGSSFMSSDRELTKWSFFRKRKIKDEIISIKKADFISSPSEFMKRFVLGSVSEVKESLIRVIANPVLDFYLLLKQREMTYLSKELKIGYVGTISQQKGVKLLINAVNSMNSNAGVIDCKIFLAGRLTRTMNDFIKKRTTGTVNYLGILDKEELLKLYYDVDLIVIPSYREPFGLVALEALRTNGLVITSDAGALPEIVKNKQNGFTFCSGSTSSLEDALLQVSSMDNDKINRIRSNAYNSVSEYSGDTYCKKMELLLSKNSL
jgi:glycosyltransferase involved in cell wall biosynthesis